MRTSIFDRECRRGWRLMESRSNSECGSAQLWELDLSRGWLDGGLSGKEACWHAPRVLDDGTTHRVYCRHSSDARIGLKGGKLYWLVPSHPKVGE